MAAPLQPNAFKYVNDSQMRATFALLGGVGLLLSASVITGAYGLVALVQANWLQNNDLPFADVTTWGVALLLLATVEGTTGLLLLFARRLGVYLGVAIAVLNIVALALVIAPYPIWSVVGIGANLTVIYVLLAIVLPTLNDGRVHETG